MVNEPEKGRVSYAQVGAASRMQPQGADAGRVRRTGAGARRATRLCCSGARSVAGTWCDFLTALGGLAEDSRAGRAAPAPAGRSLSTSGGGPQTQSGSRDSPRARRTPSRSRGGPSALGWPCRMPVDVPGPSAGADHAAALGHCSPTPDAGCRSKQPTRTAAACSGCTGNVRALTVVRGGRGEQSSITRSPTRSPPHPLVEPFSQGDPPPCTTSAPTCCCSTPYDVSSRATPQTGPGRPASCGAPTGPAGRARGHACPAGPPRLSGFVTVDARITATSVDDFVTPGGRSVRAERSSEPQRLPRPHAPKVTQRPRPCRRTPSHSGCAAAHRVRPRGTQPFNEWLATRHATARPLPGRLVPRLTACPRSRNGRRASGSCSRRHLPPCALLSMTE
jgi:hypothetical protein